MLIRIKQVDAFTKIPFGGNPAGVVTDANELDDELKQKIAREMNLSETAFVSKSDVADFKVQFFTPRFEVDLCGHATIGTFSALYEEGRLDPNKTVYYQETKAGVLPVELMEINGENIFMMTQAVPKFEKIEEDRELIAGLMGLGSNDLLDIPITKVSTGIWWMPVGVKTLDALINAKFDFKAIEEISQKYNIIGITPFCLDTLDNKYSYHVRAIAPYVGVKEDPVCGTGNGCVSSYIIKNSLIRCDNEISLIGEQGNEVNRPGCVYAKVKKCDNDIEEIKIGGTAVTILEGNMIF